MFNDASGLDPDLHDVLVIRQVICLKDVVHTGQEVLGAFHQLEAMSPFVGLLNRLALPEALDALSVRQEIQGLPTE